MIITFKDAIFINGGSKLKIEAKEVDKIEETESFIVLHSKDKVIKVPLSNVIQIAEDVKPEVKEQKSALPEDVKVLTVDVDENGKSLTTTSPQAEAVFNNEVKEKIKVVKEKKVKK